MRGIPEDRLKEAERRLRRRMTALDEAREAVADALSDATSLTGPLANTDGGSRGSGPPGERMHRGVERILDARQRLAAAEAWETVFQRVDMDFPPGSPEGKVRDLCLVEFRGEGEKRGRPVMTLADLSRAEGVDRQTIAARKYLILERIAYYAAESGLVKGEDTIDG